MLVVRIGAMGDILHALPALCGLRAVQPGWELGWMVDPRWQPLLCGGQRDGEGGVVDRVHLARTRVWKGRLGSPETWGEISELRREMQAACYGVGVDLQGSVKSAVLGRWSGVGQLWGSGEPWETPARMAYTDRVWVCGEHVIAQACELVSAAAGTPVQPAPVRLPHTPAAEAWFAATGLQPGFALLCPTAGWGAKEWGVDRFAALGSQLQADGWRVVVNVASPEDAKAVVVAERCGAEPVVCGIAELIALVRRAGLVVGGDTGPVHLGSALGRPTVALFGPTDPARTGPQAFPGARVEVLRHPRSVTSHKRTTETDPGLASVRVEEVWEAVARVQTKHLEGSGQIG